VRRPGGYMLVTEPGRGSVERDTFTCRHCNTVVVVSPGQDPSSLGGFCTLCDGHVCPMCAGKACEPFEKKLEAAERRDRLFRMARGVAVVAAFFSSLGCTASARDGYGSAGLSGDDVADASPFDPAPLDASLRSADAEVPQDMTMPPLSALRQGSAYTYAEFVSLTEGTPIWLMCRYQPADGGDPDTSRAFSLSPVELVLDPDTNTTVRAIPCVHPNYWELLDESGTAAWGILPYAGDGPEAPAQDREHGISEVLLFRAVP
jgi:hypothetical protein